MKIAQKQLEGREIEVLPIVCDITNRAACEAMYTQVLTKWGRIDALVNNAGITHIERYVNMDKERQLTQKIMEVNFFGAVNCTEVCLSQLIQHQGVIVSISSVAGFAPLIGRTAYAASKHALHGFFESLRGELKEEGVHCLMVCPSFIEAPKNLDAALPNSIYQNKKTIGKNVTAATIAKEIYSAVLKEKPLLVAGRTGKLSYWLHRLSPTLYEKVMLKKLKNSVK